MLYKYLTLSSLSILLVLLFGSVHLSMPRHDYVKSGRLAVTDKTKPIYVYIYTSKTIYLIRLHSLKINGKKIV